MASHDLEAASGLSDHFFVMKYGWVIESGTLRQVIGSLRPNMPTALIDAVPRYGRSAL